MLSVKSYLSIMRWGLWRLSRGDLPDSTRSIDIIPARINENSAMFWAVPRLNEVIWCRTIVGLQTSCERFGLQSSATDGSINRLCNLSRNVFELVPIDSYLSQSDLTTIHYMSKWSLNLIHPNFYHMYLHLSLSIVSRTSSSRPKFRDIFGALDTAKQRKPSNEVLLNGQKQHLVHRFQSLYEQFACLRYVSLGNEWDYLCQLPFISWEHNMITGNKMSRFPVALKF